MLQHPDAIAAMEEEWTKLRNAEWTYDDGDVHEKRKGVWDEGEVMEYDDAVALANERGKGYATHH